MSDDKNKIVWQRVDTNKALVYAPHPTLHCTMFSFDVQPGYRIGDDGKPTVTRKAERVEVARRLVACWNACEGLSTESLERSDMLSSMNQQRRQLEAQRDKLLAELRKARAALKEQLEVHIQSCTHPVTGLIPDDEDRLSIESDQDMLDGIDRVIDQAEGRATA